MYPKPASRASSSLAPSLASPRLASPRYDPRTHAHLLYLTSHSTVSSQIPARRHIVAAQASNPSPILRPDDVSFDPRVLACNSLPPKKARAARVGNELAPSIYRPHVPADRRLLLWTAPFCSQVQERFRALGIRSDMQTHIWQGLLRATTIETRECYGAGLLRWHQFCDREGIAEHMRLPADYMHLSAFYSSHIGTGAGKSLRNWMSGLRLWHLYNDAPWHGDESWLPSLKKAGDRAGVAFKRPPRGPVTKTHMRAFRASLDLSSGFGAASWANATSCFWGCRR
ncbi:hypothetical protein C8R47DRAFT_971319, partial [Mycena vitilis]